MVVGLEHKLQERPPESNPTCVTQCDSGLITLDTLQDLMPVGVWQMASDGDRLNCTGKLVVQLLILGWVVGIRDRS